MKLMRRAAILAIDRGAEYLDLELLAESYKERLASRFPGRPNPFGMEFEKLTIESSEQKDFDAGGTNRRSKAELLNQSASDVLVRKKKKYR